MKPSPSNKETEGNGIWKNFLIWASLALVLRWQVIEPRWIPSGSMLPTLQLKDKILVEKLSPKIARSRNSPLDNESLVVFLPPINLIKEGYDSKSALIKRVVGTPGDQIEVHNGKLIRNGVEVNEPWVQEPIRYEMEKVTIPKGALWVLGDNRNNSLDSHLWGFLPEENVIGKAVWRYWPIKNMGPIRFPTQKIFE